MSSNAVLSNIIAPHVSEKSTLAADANRQFVFKVANSATKLEIKQAVEKGFGVKVESVSVLNVKPKKKRFGRIEGARKGWKKAYVTLAEGHDIDYTGL